MIFFLGPIIILEQKISLFMAKLTLLPLLHMAEPPCQEKIHQRYSKLHGKMWTPCVPTDLISIVYVISRFLPLYRDPDWIWSCRKSPDRYPKSSLHKQELINRRFQSTVRKLNTRRIIRQAKGRWRLLTTGKRHEVRAGRVLSQW